MALKWTITDQSKEYLQYQIFKVKTNNNPLAYVMMTPNLDAVRHRLVTAMASSSYNFDIEYVRETNNNVADTLSHVGGRLDKDSVKELLSHTTHVVSPKQRLMTHK